MLEKTFDPAAIEARLYKRWERSGVFTADPASPEKPFCIMMPPPNVTGNLHMGHAFETALTDVLIRYKRMRGFDVLWQPGTDHASIAVHMVLEQQLAEEGKTRQDLGRTAFLEKAWAWKEECQNNITGQFRRLGATPDWTRERFTMDEGLSRAVLKSFVQLYRDGIIYRAKRLVNWDPERCTVVSDLEVEQKESKGHMWHIRYPVEGEQERFITVATTRPETMLGDTAVAVHPEDERYKDLIGASVMLPLTDRLIPIIADEYADPEQGSGAVKITPAHDFNDFAVGQRHDLPMVNIFDESACLNENAPEHMRGLSREEARKEILRELEEQDLIVEVEDIKNSVPYGQRSGVIIEPYLTDQWFVDAQTMAKPAMEAVRSGKTVFVPKQTENIYFSWMENIQPWCISRQLWWGHQIPAWYGPDGEVFVAESDEEAETQAKEHYGRDVVLTRDEDVLDTWFSSALWPFSTLGWPDETPELSKYYPTDVLSPGLDIIFFWVARMMMMGMHFMKDVPFRTVYIHAIVRDAKGQKMSKSRGNVVDPLEIIDKYGADALRFTLAAMAAQGRDVHLSDERIEGYRNFATKLWNASRFCQMNGCTPDPDFDPSVVQNTVNRWIIGETEKTASAIAAALESFKFNEAANTIYQFAWHTFCDWYLELIKPELSGDAAAEETQKTAAWVLDRILLMLNPFMPFITEELYAAMATRGADEILLTSRWPENEKELHAPDAAGEIDWLIRFISEIRSVRADMNVPAGAQITLLVKDASGDTQARLSRHDEVIRRMARLSEIDLHEGEPPKGAVQAVVDEATLMLPIADIINLDQERARLGKQIERLQADIRKIDQKLGNTQFTANAPEDVVEEQRTRKEEAEAVLNKLSHALKQLEAA